MEQNFKMLAKCFYGFEPILARELRQLGAGNVEEGLRIVTFEGDSGFMYKANLCLRTALRILKPISSFPVRNENDLYRRIKEIPWERYLGPDQSLAIDSVLKSETFTHSLYVSQKAKDAIADRFRNLFDKRPDVDTQNPDLRIHIHIQHQQCHLSLDSSGSSLHHRGYRTATNIAPINEVLAAGLLLMSGWDGRANFLDPMCGSGTFLVEAAMIACNIPANINRKHFGFQRWKDYDEALFQKIVEASLNRTREFHYKIEGYDKAPSAVSKARINIEQSKLEEYITVERQDFFKSIKHTEGPLHMVFNPPYGERLNVEMEKFYKQIGDTLKQGYPNTQAWMITANMDALKHVGLRTSKKIKVYNGRLEARLVKYEIYEGSRRSKYQNTQT
ncbi:THUMP domain-containing class I SAM-dependent RNA methyltransferase [Lentiprolixibacter aurantiacus]|uniref:THUMP domain-containing protein n=1 Tax=Lentiprolixibacter aurantiacus TaxID=2993939 RepID=A0AAE3MKE2_9FLAO|nr:THUMP domain-containing protein [Lentiprolixibacter aurantiacus]MCX2719345.1 THUMP domain-containing protein [Lentiprolixibacter aurantiacus]